MSDIDFDELDKAVNSLMNQQSTAVPTDMVQATPSTPADWAASTPLQQPVVPSVARTTSSASVIPERIVSPAVAAPSLVEQPIATPSVNPSAVSPAVRRSTGRFMDVVVPAPKTRSAPVKSVPEKPIARDSGVLTPILNTAELQDTTVAPVSDTAVSDGASAVADTAASEPMQSPFLAGVAVDKRPLGDLAEVSVAPSEEDTNVAADSPIADPWIAATNEEARANDVIPPEFGADVVALESESNLTSTTEVASAVDPLAIVAEQPAPVGATEVTSVADVAAQPSGPGDIVPQYAPEAPNSPQPSAIFEAASEEIPQQLNHPERRKSGWIVFMWIVVLIILGVGGGVAAWYFLAR